MPKNDVWRALALGKKDDCLFDYLPIICMFELKNKQQLCLQYVHKVSFILAISFTANREGLRYCTKDANVLKAVPLSGAFFFARNQITTSNETPDEHDRQLFF